MTQIPCYPWQISVWHRLKQMLYEDKLHHALMLSGQNGLGQYDLAKAFAELLLCEVAVVQELQHACRECTSCRLFFSGTHPDFLEICPEEKSRVIKIEAIRALEAHCSESPYRAGAKVVLIHPAEAMNAYAANALLKMLEEPLQKRYYFLLIVERPELLPATILSRLFKVNLPTPQIKMSQNFLQEKYTDNFDQQKSEIALLFSGGAPLKALEWLQGDRLTQLHQFLSPLFSPTFDPITHAQKWHQQELDDLLDAMYYLLFACVSAGYHLPANTLSLLHWLDFDTNKILNVAAIYQCIDRLIHVKRKWFSGVALNKQLVLESLFFHVQESMR